MLVKILIFYHILSLAFCKHVYMPTCILKGKKLYLYGGHDKQNIYNKNIYSVDLEGLKLQNQRIDWKFEKTIKNMPNMQATEAYDLGEKSNEIFNFGGNQDFAFNILDIKDFKVKDNTKGLKELLKILNLPNGFNFNSASNRDIYKFIQSDTNPYKFYLLKFYSKNSNNKNKYTNILTYDALKNTWNDTRLSFQADPKQMIMTHKDLIYFINKPDKENRSTNNYMINIKKSKITRLKLKGDIPSKSNIKSYHIKHKGEIFYFSVNSNNTTFNTYTLSLDTLNWENKNLNHIKFQLNPCIIYYKDHIMITYGEEKKTDRYTQIINSKTWTKVNSINIKKKSDDPKALSDKVNSNEITDKASLIGGLSAGGAFILLIIIIIYWSFQKQKRTDSIKPFESVTQNKAIEALDMNNNTITLNYEPSVKADQLKKTDNWSSMHPEVAYLFNEKQS